MHNKLWLLVGCLVLGGVFTWFLSTVEPNASGENLGAPIVTQTVTMLPVADSTYDIGTTSKAYREGWFDGLCFTADTCRTTWPSSSGSGAVGTSTNEIAGRLAYFTSNSGTPALLGQVATGTVASGAGISVTAGQSIIGSGLTITNTGVTSLAATSPISVDAATGAVTVSCPTCSTSSFGQTWELITNIFSQSALAPTTTQNIHVSGVGTSTFAGGLEAWRQIAAPYFHATSSTETSTFAVPPTFSSLTAALILTGSSGLTAEYAGTSCTNQFVRSLSALGVATCATVTSADVDSSIVPSTRTLTVAGTANQITSSAGAQDLSANRTWTLSLPNHVIFPSSYQAALGTTTNATSTNFTVTGNTILQTITSALVLTGSGGAVAEYTGTTCTNQFARALSALGAATCATVGAADVDLADLTAGDTSLTFSGTYDGQTARTIVLNVANANTWTAAQTFTVGAGVPGIISNSLVGIGTSTPRWALTIASSTGPQLAFTDTSLTQNIWTMRAINGNFYLATSSPLTFATSTNPALTLIPGGVAGLFGFAGTTSPAATITVGGNSTPGQIIGCESRPATSTSITINWLSVCNQVLLQMGTSAYTVTFTNYLPGATLRLITCNPGSGTAGAVTFSTDISWTSGTKPTQVTTANQCDQYFFNATFSTSTTATTIYGAAGTGYQ